MKNSISRNWEVRSWDMEIGRPGDIEANKELDK
jgi:hypothetical protein